jgi:hypothetical protein
MVKKETALFVLPFFLPFLYLASKMDPINKKIIALGARVGNLKQRVPIASKSSKFQKLLAPVLTQALGHVILLNSQ